MILFKLFFKLVISKWHSFVIYIGIFLAIFGLMLQLSPSSSNTYQPYDYQIAYLDRDQSDLAEGLLSYLAQENTLVEMADEKSIQDGLFLRTIDFGVVIESGFAQDDSKLCLLHDPGMGGVGSTAQQMIEDYLTLYRHDEVIQPDLTVQERCLLVTDQLQQHTVIDLASQKADVNWSLGSNYFNTLGYVLMSLIIGVVGECCVILFKRDVFERLQCAPLKPFQAVMAVFAGSCLLGLLLVSLMCLIVFVLKPTLLNSLNGWLFVSNAFVFGFAVVGISLAVGMIASGHDTLNHDKNMVNMFSNVIALTCSFISGFFVPQYLIHPTILKVASLTPAYWYAWGNEQLAQTAYHSLADAKAILQSQGIILLFGFVFVLLADFLYQKKRSRQAR